MPNTAHKNITGADLHEPKGAGAASASTVYVADGAGSGTWQKISTSEIDTTFKNSNLVPLTFRFDDIGTATSKFIVSPIAGDISKVYTVIDAAITTTDTIITLEIGGVAVTNSAVTIAFTGSAAGTVDSSTPSAAKTVTAGQAIEVISDGATDATVGATITLLMDVS
jgi:hypothetical protein